MPGNLPMYIVCGHEGEIYQVPSSRTQESWSGIDWSGHEVREAWKGGRPTVQAVPESQGWLGKGLDRFTSELNLPRQPLGYNWSSYIPAQVNQGME